MAKGIPIHGEKLERLWRDSLLSQEMFAAAAGYGRSGLARLVQPGIQSMHARNFDKLATFLKMERQELFKLIGVTGEIAKAGVVQRPPADSAVARMLAGGGNGVLVSELQAAADAEGITLLQLAQQISREWLDARAASSGAAGEVLWQHPDGSIERRRPLPPAAAEVPTKPKPARGRKPSNPGVARTAKHGPPAAAQK